MAVTLIAGGVGGARMALALHEALPPGELTVIGNVGDDCEHWGLSISPDLDTAPGPKSMRRHLWYTGFTRSQQAVHLIADPGVQS